MSTSFRNVKPALSAECLAVVGKLGFTNMTPVQATAIPLFLQNKVGRLGGGRGRDLDRGCVS